MSKIKVLELELSKMHMIKHLVKNIVLFLVVIIPLQLAGMIILAVYLPFLSREAKTLPNCLRWFDNESGPFENGLSGYRHYGREENLADRPKDMEGFWARYHWLAIRNAINVFKYDVMGYKPTIGANVFVTTGVYNVGDRAKNIPGFLFSRLYRGFGSTNPKIITEVFWVSQPFQFFGPRCIRVRIGHKIGNPLLVKEGKTVQWTMSISPIHPFRGKIEEKA